MNNRGLLPQNALAFERAFDLAASRVDAIPLPITDMWSAERCSGELLPYLAWAFGVDEWDDGWSDEAKRSTIREAILVQSRKGSVWSIRRVLRNAGYGSITLVEGLYGRKYDGSAKYNGYVTHGDPTEWAKYRIVLDRPITNAQAAQVRRILNITAPARCKLQEFVYTQANNIYNGAISHDGIYNHGTA